MAQLHLLITYKQLPDVPVNHAVEGFWLEGGDGSGPEHSPGRPHRVDLVPGIQPALLPPLTVHLVLQVHASCQFNGNSVIYGHFKLASHVQILVQISSPYRHLKSTKKLF